MMKFIINYLILFLSLLIGITSCTSAKVMTKEIRGITTGLGYELTSEEYKGELFCDISLTPIDGAGLIPQTFIKKKGTLLVPLILVNYLGEKFEISLGENSLNIPYGEFLQDALLAECNTSGNFNLHKDNKQLSNPEFTLTIKVGRCETKSLIKLNNYTFLWVDVFSEDGEFLSLLNNKTSAAKTNLGFNVTLNRNETPIFQKHYEFVHSHSPSGIKADDVYTANLRCLDNMAEGLSQATKQIVEEITRDLNLVIESYFSR